MPTANCVNGKAPDLLHCKLYERSRHPVNLASNHWLRRIHETLYPTLQVKNIHCNPNFAYLKVVKFKFRLLLNIKNSFNESVYN